MEIKAAADEQTKYIVQYQWGSLHRNCSQKLGNVILRQCFHLHVLSLNYHTSNPLPLPLICPLIISLLFKLQCRKPGFVWCWPIFAAKSYSLTRGCVPDSRFLKVSCQPQTDTRPTCTEAFALLAGDTDYHHWSSLPKCKFLSHSWPNKLVASLAPQPQVLLKPLEPINHNSQS